MALFGMSKEDVDDKLRAQATAFDTRITDYEGRVSRIINAHETTIDTQKTKIDQLERELNKARTGVVNEADYMTTFATIYEKTTGSNAMVEKDSLPSTPSAIGVSGAIRDATIELGIRKYASQVGLPLSDVGAEAGIFAYKADGPVDIREAIEKGRIKSAINTLFGKA